MSCQDLCFLGVTVGLFFSRSSPCTGWSQGHAVVGLGQGMQRFFRAHPYQCKALVKAQLQVGPMCHSGQMRRCPAGHLSRPPKWAWAWPPHSLRANLGNSLESKKGTSQYETSETSVSPEAGTQKRKQYRVLSLSAQPADQSLQTGPQMSAAGCSWRWTDSCIHWQVAVLKQRVKMPQLCVSGSSAKADTSKSISKASSSQLERHDPRADARLCWDQGSIHTSKINEGFGSSHQTVPRGDGQHMPRTMLPVSREELGGLSPLKTSQLPPKPPPTAATTKWNGIAWGWWQKKRQTAIQAPDFQGTESLWRESQWQQVWETLNKIRRAEQRGQNKTWDKREGMWSPRVACGQATRWAKNRVTLKWF